MLGSIQRLRNLEERADQEPGKTKNQLLNFSQLIAKLERLKADSSQQRLKLWHEGAKLRAIQRARDIHQKIIELLAQNKVARVHQLFGQMVARGASAQVILRTVQSVVDGRYRPKGFDQDDHDDSMLVRIMGGPRLLFAMQQTHGLMSSALYDKRRFISSWANRVERATVIENMGARAPSTRCPVFACPALAAPSSFTLFACHLLAT
jgi:hypothetical protein